MIHIARIWYTKDIYDGLFMAITDNAALRNKQFIDPREQAEVGSQLRQDSLQNNEPIHLGVYNPNTLEGLQARNSVVSESGVSGFLKRAKQEWKMRKQEHSRGQVEFNRDGLATKFDAQNPGAREAKKWGKSPGEMTGMMNSLKQKAKNAKAASDSTTNKLEQGIVGAMTMPISMATSELLQKSWLNLIDSWGLTLLYINFHVFCRWVFGEELFCKLGHEWLGGKSGGELKGAAKAEGSAAKGVGGEGGKMKSLFGLPEKGIGILEIIALGICDVIIFYIILMAILPYVIVGIIVAKPLEAAGLLKDAAAEIITLVTSLITSLK